MSSYFVEVGSYQLSKAGQNAPGDVFLSRKIHESDRIISVLSDGLGSGIKAGVLATLTGTLATGCIAADMSIKKTARLIMRSLPVCSERKISYSTFTIVDVDGGHDVRIIEYDNPSYLLIRQQSEVEPVKIDIPVTKDKRIGAHPKPATLRWSTFKTRFGDRLLFFSDGVTQAGMGTKALPLGWGFNGVKDFAVELISDAPDISARELARSIVMRAAYYDGGTPKDDITCGVIYFRAARRLLVVSGPPVHPEDDAELASKFASFEGKKIICGGTTANIIARELKKRIHVSLKVMDFTIPPPATMDGADLITEGIVTLGKVVEYLEQDARPEHLPENAATMILRHLLDSDTIYFLVGTKINDAHQDPNMPVELEIRRNVIKRLGALLEEKLLKQVSIQFI
jgi:hypothetical protein